MSIQQEIIDHVIYSGDFDSIRGLIAELDFTEGDVATGNISREDFTGGVFWSENGDEFAVAYSKQVMVLNKNGKLHGVAKYDDSIIPTCSEDRFSLGGGAISLADGML